MRRLVTALVPALLCLTLAPPAGASSNNNAKIALHVTAPTTKNQCVSGSSLPTCQGINTTGTLYPAAYYVYILVTNGDAVKGIAGLQFGIDYDGAPHSGVDVFGWTLCATMNFYLPGWPAAGTGNLVTWDTTTKCQRYEPGGPGTGVVANVGYLYVAAYSPDQLRIVPRPVDAVAKVADCDAVEYILEGEGVLRNPSPLGYATFSSSGLDPGYNPCVDQPPSNLTCSIGGPSSVPQLATGIGYSATASVPGATFGWSISGNGSIQGSATGANVTVNAGSQGDFTLYVTTSASGLTSVCSKTVTVTAGPECLISGPEVVVRNSGGYVYSVSSSAPGATFLWGIDGNGTITTQLTGSSVDVESGSGLQPFTLSVQVTSGGSSGTCSKIVTVIENPTCELSGPGSVVQSATSHYTCATNPPEATSFAWSVTGSGTLVGTPTGPAADVIAGVPGTYTVLCNFTSAAGSGTCSKMVAVQAPATPTCLISGESTVVEGSPNHQYQASSSLAGATYAWSIAGNGTITTATTGPVIRVNAGAAGSYTLTLIVAATGSNDTCEKIVVVDPTPPGSPGLNNNAKVMFHLLSPTTKNPCTRSSALPECNAVITDGGIYPQLYYAYVLMNDGYTNGGLLSGIGSIDFGVDYSGPSGVGVDLFSWNLCGDGEFPMANWPAPGSGNRVTWNASNCQRYEPGGRGTGVVLTPGYFYMAAYTPDALRIVPPPGAPVKVTDCQGFDSVIEGGGVEHFPSHLGQAGFGGAPGYNPCGLLLPIRPTTWSDIKTLYR